MKGASIMSCMDCRFWDGEGQAYGRCRRLSPRMTDGVLINDMGDKSIHAMWPSTKDTDWCGEFEPSDSEVDV